MTTNRRAALHALGAGVCGLAALNALTQRVNATPSLPSAATRTAPSALRMLEKRLAAAPRRRDFTTVPLFLTSPTEWDYEAASEILAYRYASLQMWENSDLAAPWPALMREAMNGQVFAHQHTEFLAVSATHGLAHLALFTQPTWDKYHLAAMTQGKFATNTFLNEKEGVSPTDDIQNVNGFYGPFNNNIASLQRRGAVFLACHDSIHSIARSLHDNQGFSATGVEKIGADLTNSLIPGAILVPSVVAFLIELQRAGFTYAKGG